MTTLGKYELFEPLGRGGFGTVYRAEDRTLERPVAVKVLHAALAADMEFLERFQQEARVSARFRHPNLVGVYEVGEVEGRFFIAMEYMPGGSLQERLLKKGRLKYAEAAVIIQQVCAGLQMAHTQGLVHRDLKPGNILFGADGQAVLSDFGLAKAASLSSGSASSLGTVGTPYYKAPELWLGKPPACPATDVYSLASMFYEMLSGKLLFPGDTPDQVITRHLVLEPDFDPDWLPADAPEGLEALLRRALQRDPEMRFKDAGEFAAAASGLEKVVSIPTVPAEPTIHPSAPPTPSSSDQPSMDEFTKKQVGQDEAYKPARPIGMGFWVGMGLFLLMAFVIGMVWLFRNPGATNPTATSAKLVEPWISPADGMVMAYIPAGEFQMGSENGDDDEKPVHTVSLDAFWMDTTEVTNVMFAAFLNEEGNRQEGGVSWIAESNDARILKTPGGWRVVSSYENHPVTRVSWYGAQAYCKWAGRRLPTEAEWEKAARGGLEGKTYPWGDGEPTCEKGAQNGAQFTTCRSGTAPVASFGANGYGLFDMAGNVWEWVVDWYSKTYYQSLPESNPSGLTNGEYRVMRGGAWIDGAWILRIANRVWNNPRGQTIYFGFRCAR